MTVVMTCGVFDLLHVGHLRMLQWAQQQGDALIVMVDHDHMVNKGPGRPIRPCVERLELVMGLRCVGGAVAATSLDAQRKIIRGWRPSVFVKGLDWKGKPLPFQDALEGVGCEVRYAPYYEGHSTTETIAKLALA